MYEGKNIHYSPADQRPLCSFSGKLCRQRRLNGYALCLRHILEDSSAPYKRCANISKNGQQCSNIIPQSRQTDYCHSHIQSHAAVATSTLAAVSANLALHAPGDTQIESNGFIGNRGETKMPGYHDSSPKTKKKMRTDSTSSRQSSNDLDDPYAFPSDPEPAKPQKSPVTMAHPFPNLSQALANLASSSKQNHAQEQTSENSIARFFPELADKLTNKSKPDSPKAKISALSIVGNNKSSRTMNRLQTKIAQNKIKDKLKKSNVANNFLCSNSNSNQSQGSIDNPSSQKISYSTSLLTSTSSSWLSLDSSFESLSSPCKKSSISFDACNKERNRKKSHSKKKMKEERAKSETTLQCTLMNPWTHPGFGSSPRKTDSGCFKVNSPLFSPHPSNSSIAETTKKENGPIFCGSLSSPITSSSHWINSAANNFSPRALSFENQPSRCLLSPTGVRSPPYALSCPAQGDYKAAVSHNSSSTSGILPTTASPALPIVTQSGSANLFGSIPFSASSAVPKTDAELLDCYTSATYGQLVMESLRNVNSNKPLDTGEKVKCLALEQILPDFPAKELKETDCNISSGPPGIRVRQYKDSSIVQHMKCCVKRHSAMEICYHHLKRKKENFDLVPMGVDSSDDETDVDDLIPCQHEWLLSSSDSEKEDDELDDDQILANIRQTKGSIHQSKLRRCFTQSQKVHAGSSAYQNDRTLELCAILRAARASATATATALTLVLGEEKSCRKRQESKLLSHRPCLCQTEDDKQCSGVALPFTNQCSKHVMYNVEQQLYDYCTAKFSDNTQCCIAVFDIKHELPLCPVHAAKAENYQKNLEANRPKKPRKKTKPSALTRPPKKGKKKKNQRRNKAAQDTAKSVTTANKSARNIDDISEGDATDMTSDMPTPSSPESKDPLDNDLGNDLEESFSPGTIEKHLELPLGEHDLNEVLNKLPDDAFELFSGKNGDFSMSMKVEEEAAAFEHVLAETSKKMKASEAQVPSTLSMSMLMPDSGHMISSHANQMSNHGNLPSEHGNEDDITKEIADSILQQNLSPTGSIVDDLGHDNISALASSLTVNDLRNISQVLNASLINPTSSTETSSHMYSDNTVVNHSHHHSMFSNHTTDCGSNAYTMASISHMSVAGQCTNGSNVSISGSGQLVTGSNFIGNTSLNLPTSTVANLIHSGSTLQGTSSGQYQVNNPVSVPYRSGVNGQLNVQDSYSMMHHSLSAEQGQPSNTFNGASTSQSIAQILAALTASSKQFLSPNQDTNIRGSGQQFPPMINIENFLQVPTDGSTSVLNSQPSVLPSAGAGQYIAIPSSQGLLQQFNLGQKPPSMTFQNGLLTLPTSSPSQQVTLDSTNSALGLKFTCPLQTLLPIGLLGSSLPQGIPGMTTTILPNHSQSLVTMAANPQMISQQLAPSQGSRMDN